jgi:hypothetical protein
VLAWLGDRLEPIADALGEIVPGGDNVLWIVLGSAVVLLAVLVTGWLIGRRGRREVERALAWAGPELDPRALERQADEAERRGDVELALRLRFRAGLMRLAAARAVPNGERLPSGELARRLRTPEFREVARVFDEVVYGGRPAAPADAETSRRGWERVLAEAGAR